MSKQANIEFIKSFNPKDLTLLGKESKTSYQDLKSDTENFTDFSVLDYVPEMEQLLEAWVKTVKSVEAKKAVSTVVPPKSTKTKAMFRFSVGQRVMHESEGEVVITEQIWDAKQAAIYYRYQGDGVSGKEGEEAFEEFVAPPALMPTPKFKVGDWVKYQNGDVDIENWVGVIKEVLMYDEEFRYNINAYTKAVRGMHESAKTNQKYEVQLKPATKELYEITKKFVLDSQAKSKADREAANKPSSAMLTIQEQIGVLYYIESKVNKAKDASTSIYSIKNEKGLDAQTAYLLNLGNYVDKAIENNELPEVLKAEVFTKLEENNAHTLNNALELLGYFGLKRKTMVIASRDAQIMQGFDPKFPMIKFAGSKPATVQMPATKKAKKAPVNPNAKKEKTLANKQAELKVVKDKVLANAKFKEKLANELTKHLNSNGLGAEKVPFSMKSLDDKIKFIQEQIKFYKNVLTGDKADFKAIGKRIGLDYRKSKPKAKSSKAVKLAEQIDKAVNQVINIDEKLAPVSDNTEIPFDAKKYFKKSVGGWTKSVTGLDKTVRNGYSIMGEFLPKEGLHNYKIGEMYLDCDIFRASKQKRYTLFTLDKYGQVTKIDDTIKSDTTWATDLWSSIIKYAKQHNFDLTIKEPGLGKPKAKAKPKNRMAKKPETLFQKISNWFN